MSFVVSTGPSCGWRDAVACLDEQLREFFPAVRGPAPATLLRTLPAVFRNSLCSFSPSCRDSPAKGLHLLRLRAATAHSVSWRTTDFVGRHTTARRGGYSRYGW